MMKNFNKTNREIKKSFDETIQKLIVHKSFQCRVERIHILSKNSLSISLVAMLSFFKLYPYLSLLLPPFLIFFFSFRSLRSSTSSLSTFFFPIRSLFAWKKIDEGWLFFSHHFSFFFFFVSRLLSTLEGPRVYFSNRSEGLLLIARTASF